MGQSPLFGVTLHDELIDGQFHSGDLSADMTTLTNPSSIGPLAAGENQVFGTTNFGSTGADFFTFTVLPGFELTSFAIDFLSFATDEFQQEIFQLHFISFDDGQTLSFVEENNTSLFATLVEAAEVEVAPGGSLELLDFASDGGSLQPGGTLIGQGFTAPLPAGDYTVFFQETSGTPIDYTFSFTATPVPEPTTTLTLGFLAVLLLFRRR